jgi:LPXTG-motif cell wall-anchored protein
MTDDRFFFRALNPNDTSARPPTSSSVPFPSNTPSSSSSGPSTGAEAGIGVGTAAGALVLISLAIFFIRRHRRRSKHAGIAELDSHKKGGLKEFQAKEQHPELQGREYDPVELDSTSQSYTHEIGDGS